MIDTCKKNDYTKRKPITKGNDEKSNLQADYREYPFGERMHWQTGETSLRAAFRIYYPTIQSDISDETTSVHVIEPEYDCTCKAHLSKTV